MTDINSFFAEADYIIGYNSMRFDLPVLAKMKSDIRKMGMTNCHYVHEDGEALIGYDDNRNPLTLPACWLRPMPNCASPHRL